MSVQFISLGPGSSATVTSGALRAMNEADRIYCFGNKVRSRAKEIISLADVKLLRKVECIDVPMSTDRTQTNKVYDSLAETIKNDVKMSMKVAVATEGDTGIFATTHYVMDRLVRDGVECEQIAGVPSFIAAAAVAGLHLVQQDERLMVIPGRISDDEIVHLTDAGCTLVIMKLSMARDAVSKVMARRKDLAYHYFENIGTAEQRYVLLTEAWEKFPYFSLMIIKRKQ